MVIERLVAQEAQDVRSSTMTRVEEGRLGILHSSVFFLARENNADQERIVPSSLRPSRHRRSSTESHTPATVRKDSNVIAKSKAGGNSAGFTKRKNIHAKGNLDRQVAVGPNNSVHWSAYDVEVRLRPRRESKS